MQKQVSKQSLAIVALSILLAISMALTATFAAFQATASATGTVTFTGSTTLTLTGFGDGVTNNGSAAVTNGAFGIEAEGSSMSIATANASAKVTLGGSASWVKITLTEDNTAANAGAVAVALKPDNANADSAAYELVDGVLYSKAKIAVGDIFNLADILNLGTCTVANLVDNSVVTYALAIEVRTTNDATNPMKPAQP